MEIDGKTDRSEPVMALIGYARVSTGDQKLALQHDALKAAGCERIFDDHASGAKTDRPGLAEALAYLRADDTLVVWKLDRLGRSMSHLIEKVGELAARGVGFRSLTEQIDTTTSAGMLVFNIFGPLAQFERDLIREHANAGQGSARAGEPRWATPRHHARQAEEGARTYRRRPHRPGGRHPPQGWQDRPL
jgi:DNA invertase Pin-like site-specific DNA recombinase